VLMSMIGSSSRPPEPTFIAMTSSLGFLASLRERAAQ
jgi:hypothetical protein